MLPHAGNKLNPDPPLRRAEVLTPTEDTPDPKRKPPSPGSFSRRVATDVHVGARGADVRGGPPGPLSPEERGAPTPRQCPLTAKRKLGRRVPSPNSPGPRTRAGEGFNDRGGHGASALVVRRGARRFGPTPRFPVSVRFGGSARPGTLTKLSLSGERGSMTAAVTGLRLSWSGAAPDGFGSAARLGSGPPGTVRLRFGSAARPVRVPSPNSPSRGRGVQ